MPFVLCDRKIHQLLLQAHVKQFAVQACWYWRGWNQCTIRRGDHCLFSMLWVSCIFSWLLWQSVGLIAWATCRFMHFCSMQCNRGACICKKNMQTAETRAIPEAADLRMMADHGLLHCMEQYSRLVMCQPAVTHVSGVITLFSECSNGFCAQENCCYSAQWCVSECNGHLRIIALWLHWLQCPENIST